MQLIDRFKNKTLAGFAVAAVICLAAVQLNAATIDVTTTADELTNNNQCSLREAIINTNDDAATHSDCAAGSGADTINLPAGVYTLSILGGCEDVSITGDLDIMDDLIIAGAGADSTIIEGNASFNDRIIDVYSFGGSNLLTLVISDVTIRGGAPGFCLTGDDLGGGIRNVYSSEVPSDVTLNRVVVTDNDANSGGAGIYNGFLGTMTINNSTVSQNTSTLGNGGGISNVGTITIVNSTISGNYAEQSGGGIHFIGNQILNLRNVTVTNNTVNIGDGGGLAVPTQSAVLRTRNTIIAGNTDNDSSAPDCSSPDPSSIISEGYNLIGDNRGCVDGVNATWAATDQIGDVAGGGTAIDPLLGGLANNGGTTPTHALDPLSPAVDAANDVQGCTSDDAQTTVLTDDQRGEPRPEDADGDGNAVCDIGAYELQGICGDGAVQSPDEECDNGVNNSDTVPDACRTDCTLPSCGDGVVDTGEECDDGNTVDGDGCSSSCVVEPACGDGVLDAGEGCDDGNTVDGDGCSSTCVVEATCGNGVLDAGEECDDGNNVDLDGCSSTCTNEAIVLLGDGGCNLIAVNEASQNLGMMLMAGALGTLALLRKKFF